MKKLSVIAFVAACATVLGVTPALADSGVSVLVSLTPLTAGSMPVKITTYGRVVPAQKARRTLSAPVAAEVRDVEVRTGQTVTKGESLVTLVPSPQTRADYKQAQLALKVAKHLLARSRQLFASHLETAAQLAQDEKTEADARARLDALTEEGANGPNTLKAPFNAIVMKIDVSSGSFVSQGSSVVELARPEGLVFRTGLVPALAMEVKMGDEAKITPFSGSGDYQGKVILRGSVVGTDNGLVPIDVSLPDSALLTGEMGQVEINTGLKSGYIVPHSALLLNPSGQTYIVQSVHMVAKIVLVKVLSSEHGKDLVEGKVVAGAPVVTTGNYQLDNGTGMHTAGGSASPSNKGSSGNGGQ